MKRIAFIVNPISGVSDKSLIIDHLYSVFSREDGYDALFHKTECSGDAYATALKFSNEGYDIVAAVGYCK